MLHDAGRGAFAGLGSAVRKLFNPVTLLLPVRFLLDTHPGHADNQSSTFTHIACGLWRSRSYRRLCD